jgi:vacuolar-type H+-ATPase subunit F/Vma7
VGRIAAIGERVRVQGFRLAGALVFDAEEPTAVRAAWNGLPMDVAVVVLTPASAAALDGDLDATNRLTVVMAP